jgi:enoyl-CoA hydratase/carnithine racemase
LGFVTVLGGVYRVAERVGSRLAYQWALTSEQVPADVMERHGLVNKVFSEEDLLEEARIFAARLASGATMAHAAHKALLRSAAVGGIAAADDVMFDLTSHLLDSSDMKKGITSAHKAFVEGGTRPVIEFDGH